MAFFLSIFIFLFGLIIGSFLNCVIYRLAPHHFYSKSGGGLGGRSYCPHCKHFLDWKDLIPLLSFFILKGKCRYCHQKISFQYPLVELFTALLFVLIFNLHFISNLSQLITTLYLFTISSLLMIIFVYDLKYYIIPDKIVYPAILITGIWYLISIIFFHFYTKGYLINTLYSAFLAALFFLLIVYFSQGKWMGVGDIKLAFFMGLFLGFPNILVALFSAFFFGAIIGLGLIFLGKKTMKSELPFAPFLITGTFLALFSGQQIINWYLNFFKL